MAEEVRAAQPHHRYQHEIDLLTEVAGIVRQAIAEYEGEFAVAGRLEIVVAQRKLDRAYHGEAA